LLFVLGWRSVFGNMRHTSLALKLLIAMVLPATLVHFVASSTTIPTPLGSVDGKVMSTGAVRYASIPYAEPPTGSRRWRSPQLRTRALTDDGSVFDATYFGPACPQQNPVWTSALGMSEDCLHLNVYVPPVVPEVRSLL
jgi:carboxylesterase type B